MLRFFFCLSALLWANVQSHPAALLLRNALSGTTLRCCVIHEPPIVFLDQNTHHNNGISGIISNYLTEMQALLGWQCSSIVPYVEGNGTSFNRFIDMMGNCSENGSVKDDPKCPCDIGIGGWFASADRESRVDVLPPFVFDGIRVTFHVSNTYSSGDKLFFITTFDFSSWLCIGGIVLLFAVAKFLDHRFVPIARSEQTKVARDWERFKTIIKKSSHRLGRAIKSTVMRVVLQSDQDIVPGRNRNHSWTLNLAIGIFGLLMVLAYEASMTASLVQETVLSDFKSVEDFKTCRINPEDVCVPGGSAVLTFWNEAIAYSECHKDRVGKSFFRGSFEETLAAVQNGTCKFGLIIDSTLQDAINGRYCGQLLASEEHIYTAGLSMILPNNSNYTSSMSKATLVLRNEASTPSMQQYFQKLPKCRAVVGSVLTFEKLYLFFVFAFATGVIFIIIKIAKSIFCANSDDVQEARSEDSVRLVMFVSRRPQEDSSSSSL